MFTNELSQTLMKTKLIKIQLMDNVRMLLITKLRTKVLHNLEVLGLNLTSHRNVKYAFIAKIGQEICKMLIIMLSAR